MIFTQPDHFSIAVESIEESITWYEKTFGFKCIARWDVAPVNTQAAMLKRDNFQLELFEREGHHKAASPDEGVMGTFLQVGLSHIAFTVQDLAAAREQLSVLGIKEETDVNRNPVLDDQWIFIKDINGVYIELVQKQM